MKTGDIITYKESHHQLSGVVFYRLVGDKSFSGNFPDGELIREGLQKRVIERIPLLQMRPATAAEIAKLRLGGLL